MKAVKTSILKAKLLDNLESEIAILKSLNHRHITALTDIVVRILLSTIIMSPCRCSFPDQKAEKHVYIVMDYCSGGDLSQYIRARGKIETLEYVPEPGAAPIYFPHPKSGGLDQRVVRSLLLQLADALKFLRDRNLMHRDLKPQASFKQVRGVCSMLKLISIAEFVAATSSTGRHRFRPYPRSTHSQSCRLWVCTNTSICNTGGDTLRFPVCDMSPSLH